MSSHLRSVLAGALVAMAVVAACSDDTDDAAPSTTAATSTTAGAPSTTAGVTTTGTPASSAPTTGAPDEVTVPTLSWAPCSPGPQGGASTDGLECANATVPVDYDDPGGDTFELALIRRPADDAANRIGTLFWNPGGPSDAGTSYLPAAIDGFPPTVRQRFDVFSWDPRGMGGRTTPVVQCFESAEAEAAFTEANAPAGSAVTDEQLLALVQFRDQFSASCVEHAGDLLEHVSTADNARDLDLVRQALGEDQVSYYGTSYGTFLGATYINMFPDTVRSAVLDGVVFPSAWAELDVEDPDLTTFLRVGSDQGSAATVQEFFRQCGLVDASACAFSAGSPDAIVAKWNDLLATLASAPATVDGQPVGETTLLDLVQSSIYLTAPLEGFDRFPGWPGVAEQVEAVWQAAQPGAEAPPTTDAAPPPPSSTPPGPATYVTSGGRQLAVICGESPNPTTDAAYVAQAEVAYARSGYNSWPWVAACSGWTAEADEAYLGPWDAYTEPVLLVATTFDPATPYSSAQRGR